MMIYKLSEITKNYEDRTVLNVHALDIEKGKIYALLGANGAGKTTLLNILAFLTPPSTGEVYYNENPVRFSEKYLYQLRQKVVMIAQYPVMFSTTVYKNIEFGLKIRKIPPRERKQIITESMEMVDIMHLSNENAQHLSGGETQRVAFARAMALSPDVILCDEPTSSVDFENQSSIIQILTRINKEKKITLVFTSHDKLQASTLAHHQIFLEHGKLANASYENLFTGIVSQHDNLHSTCTIQNALKLMIPKTPAEKIRLLIDPEKIDIIPDLPEKKKGPYISDGISDGKIIQIAEENKNIRMMIDTGIPVTILISRQKYADLSQNLIVGEKISIRIPPKAIQLL